MPQRVAVIGAGAAGLCAARYLSAKPDVFEPVVFEKADCIGGTWVFTEETGTDRHGLPIHTSMYKNLQTNLPKEVMAFPDFPFDPALPSFVTHADVLHYLEQYTVKFALLKYIKFHTVVECITPIPNGKTTQWEVTVRDLNDKDSGPRSSIFDAVMVCNGHYSVPNMPKLVGQETFKGNILHSHSYRKPEDFKGSTIVCVGAGNSGQDIVLDLHTHARKVYRSHWKQTLPYEFPTNIVQVPAIKSVYGNTVNFTDGQSCEADSIIFCTGYEYSFPFLSKECQIKINDNRVSPLYKHLIHTDYHNLSFLGLQFHILPFPQFSYQVRLVLAVLEGSHTLPSKEEIESDNEKDLQKRLDKGWPHRYAHRMGPLQWEYTFEITQLAGVSPIKPVIESIHKDVLFHRQNNVCHYKKFNYEIVDDHTWHKVGVKGSE